MSNKLDKLVGNCSDNRSQNENIDPAFPLEVEIDNSFVKQIPLLQTANPRGCDIFNVSKGALYEFLDILQLNVC